MKKTTAWRRRLVLTAIICSASVLLVFAFGSFLPDPTWRALNTARKMYAGIVSRLTPLPTGADKAAEEENIREAVLREMIGPRGPRGLFFLQIGGNDPTDEFMSRFAAWAPAPMKASKATTFDFSQGYIDRTTGRHGALIRIGSIKWLFGDRVEVEEGFVCGGLCGSGGVYQLVKRKGRWMVETYTVRWVS